MTIRAIVEPMLWSILGVSFRSDKQTISNQMSANIHISLHYVSSDIFPAMNFYFLGKRVGMD